MNKKMGEGRDQRIPYMLIVGDRDIENGTVSVRLRTMKTWARCRAGGFIDMAKHVIDHKLMSLQ
jgi:threonyl-tRNA synthetase